MSLVIHLLKIENPINRYFVYATFVLVCAEPEISVIYAATLEEIFGGKHFQGQCGTGDMLHPTRCGKKLHLKVLFTKNLIFHTLFSNPLEKARAKGTTPQIFNFYQVYRLNFFFLFRIKSNRLICNVETLFYFQSYINLLAK